MLINVMLIKIHVQEYSRLVLNARTFQPGSNGNQTSINERWIDEYTDPYQAMGEGLTQSLFYESKI